MNEEVKNDNVVTEETTLVNNEESKVVEEKKNETIEVEVVPTEQEKKPETLFSKIPSFCTSFPLTIAFIVLYP